MTADRPKIYLAGPDVFLANALEVGARKKAICAEHGLEGLFPLDQSPDAPEGASGPEIAARIYAICLRMMGRCDGVVANISPFRGPGVDDGTAFEIGWLTARAKPVAAYDNGGGDLPAKTARVAQAAQTGGAWTPYTMVESFGLPANLMIAIAAQESAGFVTGETELSPDDLSRFEAAVKRIASTLKDLP